MTRRLVFAFACFFTLFISAATSVAQTIDGEMLAPKLIDRFGLERVWFTHAQVTPARGRIIDLQLYISRTQSLTVFEVQSSDGTTQVFSERDLDTFGDEVGIEGAEERANEYVAALTASGGTAESTRRSIPELTLYVTTDLGVIHALDGRTGATRWAAAFGNPEFPMARPAIHEQYVAVANGTQLYMVDAANGHLMWNVKCSGLPLATGTFSETTLFVPLMNGQISAYGAQPEAPKWPEAYYTRGTVHYAPTVVGKSVIWASDAGDISVATVEMSGLRYRLMVNGAPAGRLAAQAPRTIFAASQAGTLYSFDLARGEPNWELSTGEDITVGPTYVNKSLYVPTKRDGMYALSAETGDIKWSASGVVQFLVEANGLAYGLTDEQRLVALEAERGFVRANGFLGLSDLALTNAQTDWIYIATRRGLVYCLRPHGSRWPTIYEGQATPAAGEAAGDETQEAAEQDQPAADGSEGPLDPFGGQTNPFGDSPPDDGAGAGMQDDNSGENLDPFGS